APPPLLGRVQRLLHGRGWGRLRVRARLETYAHGRRAAILQDPCAAADPVLTRVPQPLSQEAVTQQLELDLWREPPPPAPAPTRAATSPGAPPEPLALARRQARALARSLSVALGVPVRLALTDNRRTMLSSRRDGSTWIIRAHHLFLEAGEAVAQAMARYLRDGDARAGATIDAFIAEQQAAVVASRRRSTVLVTAGRHHDLRTIFDDL